MASEKGFLNPSGEYWQAIGGGDVADYGPGVIEVPIRPSPRHKWMPGKKKWAIDPNYSDKTDEAEKDAIAAELSASPMVAAIFDEINKLRVQLKMPAITRADLESRIKAKVT